MIKLDNNNGFSLLELMIALSILAVGILAIVSMQITSIEGNDKAMKFTDASMAAQTQMEIFLMTNYGNISNDSASTADGYTEVTNADLDAIAEGYTLEYRVVSESDMDGDGTNDFKEINVRVRDNEDEIRSNITMTKERG
jgi:type IV pilus assembly protein PilV